MAGNAYLAVAAKVRAMYGGRMTGEDYGQLMGKTTIPQAAAFLQSHRGTEGSLRGCIPRDCTGSSWKMPCAPPTAMNITGFSAFYPYRIRR